MSRLQQHKESLHNDSGMPLRKRRAESFFGLHFDFHADPNSCPDPIGLTLKEEDIRTICRELRPDFIQIDCKGHPGWASYPTKIGNAMPAFCGDPLRLWRDVTASEGVALYMHYSGVYDMKYCAEHPQEAVMHADGTRSDSMTCRLGRYDDDLLIPQLLELAGEYGVDGVWVDGECWASDPDYDPRVIEAFKKETGIDLAGRFPVKREDPYYDEFIEFNRELFRRHVRYYTDAVHAKFPDFQIASNWAFTDHMPEPVSANVDFLSGDFDPIESLNSARYAGRAIALQHMPWDLMSWNFRSDHKSIHIDKHPCQIMQEASVVAALGGGYQDYINQKRDGSPQMAQILNLKELPAFLRQREKYCRGVIRHEIGMLMSMYDRNANSDGLYQRTGIEKLKGLTSLFCDIGYSMEIVSEATLKKDISFPVLVVPELYRGLEPETAAMLVRYVKDGGKLILVGSKAIGCFEKAGLPVGCGEEIGFTAFRVGQDSFLGSVAGACPLSGAEDGALAHLVLGKGEKPLAAVIPYGKGFVVPVGMNLGTDYNNLSQFMHKNLMRAILESLFTPDVRIESARGSVDMVELEVGGRLMIQLVNTNGHHKSRNIATEDDIPPVIDLELSVKAEKKPSCVRILPEGTALPFTYDGSRVRFTVPRLDIYEIVTLED